MTISQVITALPPAPQRTDPPAVFVPKADAHVASLDGLVTEINILGGEINTTQGEINTTQTEVEATQAEVLVTQTEVDASAASAAASAASAAGSANFAGEWSTLTGALNTPATVLHSGVYWQLLTNLADVTASEPTTASSDWALSKSNVVEPKTAAATLSINNPNELQDGTAFVVPLANSVPVNWYIDVEQPDTFKAFKPTLTRSGSDVFSNGNGTDTTITFAAPTMIRLTSDGASVWRI